jgi:hypothetical protein
MSRGKKDQQSSASGSHQSSVLSHQSSRLLYCMLPLIEFVCVELAAWLELAALRCVHSV